MIERGNSVSINTSGTQMPIPTNIEIITAASVAMAFSGKGAFTLLEESYAVGLTGFFVPLTIALYGKYLNETSVIISILVGIGIWVPEVFIDTELPLSIIAVFGSLVAYYGHAKISTWQRG